MNGDFAGGDGTTNNPYLIEDADDLNTVRNNLSASYKLIKDIDLDVSPYNEGTGWNPIGDASNRFTGTFNGNGHIIKNLFIKYPGMSTGGLFGSASNCNMQNIGIENINITTGSNAGGLIGNIGSSNCKYCYTTGKIQITGNQIGGLIGTASSSNISNSYSNVNIIGINIKGIGGLIGYNNGSTIINSYSIGLVSGTSNVGGLIGEKYNGSISNSYWDKETSSISTSAGGIGLTTLQMKDPSNFINWNNQMLDDGITPVWILKEGEYPKLWFEKPPIKCLIKDNNKYKYTQDGNVLNTIANEDTLYNNFNTYGMNDLSNINENIINVLENNKYNINMLR